MKLNDLKVRELKKQVPNTKLKPLSKRDGKTNMSVDNRLNEDYESLIENSDAEIGKARGKKPLPSGKSKNTRLVMRQGSSKELERKNPSQLPISSRNRA